MTAPLRKRLLLAAFAPALALLALEGGLRLAGYGFCPRLLVKDPRTGQRVTNPEYGRLYFPRALARRPEPVWLADPKPAGEYRIFILGESAALGHPDPAYGFGRQLEVLLGARPARRCVVANLAMTAINSHAFPGIAAEALAAGADALVVLAGNNEVVGPFGAGTVFDRTRPGRAVVRLRLMLRGTRVGQLLAALRERADAGGAPATWGGLAMFLDHRVAADDPRLARTYADFRANVQEVLGQARRRGVPVLLCTVPVNLRDCPPFADNKDGEAQRAYQGGLDKLAAGDTPGALDALQRARDLDQLRFRADSQINRILRELGAGTPGVTLVDAERAFAAAGPPGAEVFHEHVHFTFAGDYALARLVADAWAGLVHQPPSGLERIDVARALAFTASDEARAAAEIAEAVALPPFTGQAGHAQDHARRQAALADLQARGRAGEEAGLRLYAEALQARPSDFRLRLNHAQFLTDTGGDPAATARAWAWVAQRMPDQLQAQIQVALARARGGQVEPARQQLEQLARAKPRQAGPLKALGDLALESGRFEEAIERFRAVLDVDPASTSARLSLGVAHQRSGRLAEAEQQYRTALAETRNTAGLMNLGGLLVRMRRYAEARSVLEEAVAAGAEEPGLFNNLGLALLALGEFSPASAQLKHALARQPDHPHVGPLLGEALARSGYPEEALQQYRTVLEKRYHPGAAAGVALVLAAAPEASLRNPAEARALARHVIESTRTRFPEAIEALAAAEASDGRYEEALPLAEEAARLFDAEHRPALAALVRARIERYRAHQPAWLPERPVDGGRKTEDR